MKTQQNSLESILQHSTSQVGTGTSREIKNHSSVCVCVLKKKKTEEKIVNIASVIFHFVILINEHPAFPCHNFYICFTGSHASNNPALNFIVYIPTQSRSPLYILDSSGEL